MADIFEMFGGGGGLGRTPQGPRRGENVVHRLKVSLEELHRGATRKLSLQRNVKCGPCSGVGTRSGRRYPCEACGGSGIQVSMRPLGPGTMQQIQHACGSCRQTGSAVPPSDRCPSCSGRGLVPERKVFEVHVEPGHRHGSKIVLRGEAGCPDPSVLPGDVVFVLEQKPHATFKRIGTDLVMDRRISLAQALTGTSFDVPTLEEGRSVRVRHAAGTVVKPDTWMRVADEGMPTQGRPYEKGNLYIHYTVDFPDALTAEQVQALRGVLGGDPAGAGGGGGGAASSSKAGGSDGGAGASAQAPPTDMDADGTTSVRADGDGVDVVIPAPVKDIESELQQRRSAAKAEEGGASYASSDEEDGGRGRGVQCAQQ